MKAHKYIKHFSLPLFSFVFGGLSILLSFLIVVIAYNYSVNKAEENLYKFYKSKALFLNAVIETNNEITNDKLLQYINDIYVGNENYSDDEYICIIDQWSNLILHTLHPNTVGNNTGNNILLDRLENECTLADLVKERENYIGHYISSAGEAQIAAFEYVPSRNWMIGIHRSEEKLRNEVKSQFTWFIFAFVIIIGVIIPFALIRLYSAFKNSERKKISLEKEIQYHLQLKNEEFKIINEELHQTNIDLLKSKIKAEESDRLKSAFLENMSHEIRTPMNAIIGFARLLRKPNISSEELNKFIKIIIDSSNQLLKIVNDILDISKIETGQVELFLEKTSINTVISEIFTSIEFKAREKNLDLNIHKNVTVENDQLITDQLKLKQIFLNLINNAIKFTEKGSVDFGYSVENQKLVFFVKDTGIGIPENKRHNIFERFSQVENTSVELYGGNGLGLAICKGYIEALGGDIWFESEEYKGTEFYFTLPYNSKLKA